jgi:hypothetical protein
MNNENKFQFKDVFRMPWNPKPVDPPVVDPDLEHLDGISRSAESIRYSVLSIEFWLSKDGQIREWLRHNGRLAAVLAVPAFVILPILTFALWQLVIIAGHLIVFPILGLLAALAILVVINVAKAVFK